MLIEMTGKRKLPSQTASSERERYCRRSRIDWRRQLGKWTREILIRTLRKVPEVRMIRDIINWNFMTLIIISVVFLYGDYVSYLLSILVFSLKVYKLSIFFFNFTKLCSDSLCVIYENKMRAKAFFLLFFFCELVWVPYLWNVICTIYMCVCLFDILIVYSNDAVFCVTACACATLFITRPGSGTHRGGCLYIAFQ